MKRLFSIIMLTLLASSMALGQGSAGIDSLRVGKLLRLSSGSLVEVHGLDRTDFFTRLDAAARADSTNITNEGLGIEDFSPAARAFFGGLGSGMYAPDGSALTWYILAPDTFVTIATAGVKGSHLGATVEDTVQAYMDRFVSRPVLNAAAPKSYYYLDGSGDDVEITSTDELADDVSRTVMMWLKVPSGQPSQYPRIFSKGYSYYAYGANYGNSGNVSFNMYDGADAAIANIPCTTIFDNEWHHIAMVIDRENQQMHAYLDGVLIASDSDITDVGNVENSTNVTLGSSGASSWLKGCVGGFSHYTAVLTTKQIWAIASGKAILNEFKDADQTELISNGTFETLGGGGADVYANWTESTSGTSTVSNETSDVYSGSNSAKLTTDGSNSLVAIQQAILTPGRAHSIGFWAKRGSAVTTQLLVNAGNFEVFTLTDSWTYYEATLNATQITLSLQRGSSGTAGQIILIDNVSGVLVGNSIELAGDKTTDAWHDAYGRASAVIENAILVNAPAMSLSTMRDPATDAVLEQRDIVESSTVTSVAKLQAEGDRYLRGSEASLTMTMPDALYITTSTVDLNFIKETTPASGEYIGNINYYAGDTNGNKTRYVYSHVESVDPTDGSEVGLWSLWLYVGGGLDECFRVIGEDAISSEPEVIVNNSGHDVNFRCESASRHYGMYFDNSHASLTLGVSPSSLNTTSGWGMLAMKEGTAPTSSVSDQVYLWAADDAGTVELRAQDGAGNVSTLSSHNDANEWEYYSYNVNTGRAVLINMEDLVREVEKLSGKSIMLETECKVFEVSEADAFIDVQKPFTKDVEVSPKDAMRMEYEKKQAVDSTKFIFKRFKFNTKTGAVDTVFSPSVTTVTDSSRVKWVLKKDVRFDSVTGKFFIAKDGIAIMKQLKPGVWEDGGKYYRNATRAEMRQ